jgi:cystathionine beta-lyase/cystathionine gamma-synthase
MLIALLIAYLLGGGSGSAPFLDLVKKFETATTHVVAEPERRKAVDSVLDEFRTAIKKQEEDQGQSVKALAKLGENHTAAEADYVSILDAHARTRESFQDRMIALRGELKARLTPAEWAAIVATTARKPSGP